MDYPFNDIIARVKLGWNIMLCHRRIQTLWSLDYTVSVHDFAVPFESLQLLFGPSSVFFSPYSGTSPAIFRKLVSLAHHFRDPGKGRAQLSLIYEQSSSSNRQSQYVLPRS